MEFDKDKVTKAELRQLNRLLKQVPPDKQPVGKSLVKELAFMAGTLAELREHINQNGAIEYFKQGKQEFFRESPALRGYNTTIQRYSLLYKQLVDLLPKDNKPDESELLSFLTDSQDL